MKILALTSSFPLHAKDERSVFIKRLYDAIAASGVDLTLVAPHSYQGLLPYRVVTLSREYAAFGGSGLIPTIRANPFSALYLPQAVLEFKSIIAEIKPDVVHANWSLTAMAAIASGYPTVVTLRGADVPMLKVPIIGSCTKLVFKKAAVITAVGSSLAAEASRLIKRSVVVIENGVELVSPEPIDVPQRYLLAVGTVIPRKQTFELISAFKKFSLRNSSHNLVIAGRLADEKYANAVRELIVTLELQQRVHLLSAVTPGQITTLLQNAAAFVSFSKAEGRPNAVLEAQAAGIPCVLSSIQAHLDMLKPNDRIFDAADVEAACGAMLLILTGDRSSVNNHVKSWHECAAQYVELFRRLSRPAA